MFEFLLNQVNGEGEKFVNLCHWFLKVEIILGVICGFDKNKDWRSLSGGGFNLQKGYFAGWVKFYSCNSPAISDSMTFLISDIFPVLASVHINFVTVASVVMSFEEMAPALLASNPAS